MAGVGRPAAVLSLALAAVLAIAASPAVAQPTDRASRSWPVNTDGKGCAPPTWPAADATFDDSRVLVLGDSLIRESRSDLEAQLTSAGYLPSVRCWGGKGTAWGVAQVKQARRAGQLPRTVVVSLGTNDIWWLGVPMDVAVDRMMAALGPKRTVYWVNLWFGQVGYALYNRLPRPKRANEILRAKAKQYPNLRIVNFAGAFRAARSAGQPVGWADGVHLNQAGYRLRNRTIVAALSQP